MYTNEDASKDKMAAQKNAAIGAFARGAVLFGFIVRGPVLLIGRGNARILTHLPITVFGNEATAWNEEYEQKN
jgi:hypothetical protein